MSRGSAIETKFIVGTSFALFWSESSTTLAMAMAASVSLSSVLSERRGSWEGIDLRFFFRDFPNAWILSLESSSGASESAPIPVKFSGFLYKSGQCSWHW